VGLDSTNNNWEMSDKAQLKGLASQSNCYSSVRARSKDFESNEALNYASAVLRRVIPESTWTEIRTAYASSIGLREIARGMGISPGTVLARAKREGWTRQIQSAKALSKREDAPAVTPVKAVAMTIDNPATRRTSRTANGWRLRARR
jgi:hypothetical protein